MSTGEVFPALGTTAAVAVAEPEMLAAARAAVDAEIAACDQACSRFRDDSDLSRLNAAGGQTIQVSSRLLDELTAALRAAHLTDGAVDPTVGKALISLGYDRDFSLVAPGSQLPRTVAFAPVPGWRCLHVDHRQKRAQVSAGVVVDLGATAKARCADLAATSAAAATGCGVLVSLGGDVAVAGAAPAGGWKVRVTDAASPAAGDPGDPGETVEILTGGLATSGVTVRTWRRGRVDLHHVIDPRTGSPATVVWRTATVAAATCTDANIASTAAIVLGRDAPAWLTARRPSGPTGWRRRGRGPGGRMASRGRGPGCGGGPMMAATLTQSKQLWYVMRGSGLVALALLTLTMVAGVVNVRRFATPALAPSRHRPVAPQRRPALRDLSGSPCRYCGPGLLRLGWVAGSRRSLHLRMGPLLGRCRHRGSRLDDRPGGLEPVPGPDDTPSLAGGPLAGLRRLAAGDGARLCCRLGQRNRLGPIRLCRVALRCWGRDRLAAAPPARPDTCPARHPLRRDGGRRTLMTMTETALASLPGPGARPRRPGWGRSTPVAAGRQGSLLRQPLPVARPPPSNRTGSDPRGSGRWTAGPRGCPLPDRAEDDGRGGRARSGCAGRQRY